MIIINGLSEVLRIICRANNKWGMFISINYITDKGPEDVFLAAPYLTHNDIQIVSDSVGYILFDNEKEARKIFDLTAGDDLNNNNYSRKNVSIYALLCDPFGMLITENT